METYTRWCATTRVCSDSMLRYTAVLRAVLIWSHARHGARSGTTAFLRQASVFGDGHPTMRNVVRKHTCSKTLCERRRPDPSGMHTLTDKQGQTHTHHTTDRTSSLASTRTTPDLAKNPFSKSFETTSSFFWSSPPAFCPPPVATPVAPAIAARCTSIDMPLQAASKAANSGTISSSPWPAGDVLGGEERGRRTRRVCLEG